MEQLLENLRQNWKAIILCVVLSTLVWTFNALNKSYTTKIGYPLDFRLRQSNIVAVLPPPSQVELRVTGKGWNLLRTYLGIGVRPVSLEINQPTRIRQLSTAALLPALTDHLKDLRINSLIQDTLFFAYNHIVSKEVVLRLRTSEVRLEKGYEITSPIKIEPATVLFKGASSLVSRLPDTLDIETGQEIISGNFDGTVPLDFPRHALLTPETDRVRVRFSIGIFIQKNMTLPIQLENFPADSSVFISEKNAMVEYHIPEERERHIAEHMFKIVVDYKKMGRSDSTIVPELHTHVKLKNAVVFPSKIKVRYVENRNHRRHRNG